MKKITLIVVALLLLVSSGLGQRAAAPPANPAIAYVKGSAGFGSLMVMNADGSNQMAVFTAPDNLFSGLSWSPVGLGTQANPYSIAFQWCFPCQLLRIEVAVVNGVPQGSPPTRLDQGDCGFCGNPAWSPSGNEIAVNGHNPTSSTAVVGLFVVPAGGGPALRLYTPPVGRTVQFPTWSPDATQLALVEFDYPGGANLVVKIVARVTGAVTATLPLGQFTDVRHLDWARTQNTLAFSTPGGVYTLSLPSGAPSFVIAGSSPSWSPNDSKLAFDDGRVKSFTFATGAVQTLTTKGTQPDWRRF